MIPIEQREKLIEEFVNLARKSYGRSGYQFWEKFVDGLINRECPSIDLERVYRKPLLEGELRTGIHKILGINEEIGKCDPSLLKLYDAIISFIKDHV